MTTSFGFLFLAAISTLPFQMSSTSGGAISPGAGLDASSRLGVTCPDSIRDQASPGSCLQASSIPSLGALHPISTNLFVSVGGSVGIGTTTPAARLHVSGTARVTDTLTLAPGGDTALNISSGSIYKGGALFIHTKGGGANTAIGDRALRAVTSGSYNTACGSIALYDTTTGIGNTAIGYGTLLNNTIGHVNTALGFGALISNSVGNGNTATGAGALFSNSSGDENTASGYRALRANGAGSANSAFGYRSLHVSEGSSNTALGHEALYSNSTGNLNTAVGKDALRNVIGDFSDRNIAVGAYAGMNLTGSQDNIAIGNPAVAGEDSTIRIGTAGTHTRAFIAGIRGVTTGVANGITVLIDSAGQLGTVSSSRRFKEEIDDMGERTGRLLELRPVVFRYKQEVQSGERPLEYGLIAEEVAEVFPELVVRDEEGDPSTVKYHVLSSMLLNELKELHARTERLEARLAELESRTAPADPLVEVSSIHPLGAVR